MNKENEKSVNQYPAEAYVPPKLTKLGRIQDLTKGGDVGQGDSGNFNTAFPS